MLTTTESIANQLSSRRTLTIKHQHHHRQRINHNSLFSMFVVGCCRCFCCWRFIDVRLFGWICSFHFVEMLFFFCFILSRLSCTDSGVFFFLSQFDVCLIMCLYDHRFAHVFLYSMRN